LPDIRVIRILDTTTLIVNAGTNDGIEAGTRFGIYTPVEDVVDPETEEVLGRYRRRKAVVVATSVYPRFTVASAPTTRRRVTETSGGLLNFGIGGTRNRTEVVQEDLPVAEFEVKPLPTGMDIHIGDHVEPLGDPAASAASQQADHPASAEATPPV